MQNDIEFAKVDGVSRKMDAWVPDGLGPFPTAVLVVLPACFPLSTAQPVNLTRTFGDDGSNLSYYNWAVGGAGGTIAPDGSGIGYDVTPNAGTDTRGGMGVSSSRASAMPPRSAAMFATLATIKRKQAPHNTHFE